MGLERQIADIVRLRADEEAGVAVCAFLEAEEFAGEMDGAAVGLLLTNRPSAKLFEEPLVRAIPVDGRVAQDL
ncbi:hypothetical protein D3C71_2011760 [compost metagenome]